MAFHRNFTYQQLEEMKIKTYVKGLFDIFGRRSWTREEWDEVVDTQVRVIMDEKQTRAQAAAKARSAIKSRKTKKKSKKQINDDRRRRQGPAPRGANTKCKTLDGENTGYTKEKGDAYWCWANTAGWEGNTRTVEKKKTFYGEYGDTYKEGEWRSPRPDHDTLLQMTHEQMVYYGLESPKDSPLAGGAPPEPENDDDDDDELAALFSQQDDDESDPKAAAIECFKVAQGAMHAAFAAADDAISAVNAAKVVSRQHARDLFAKWAAPLLAAAADRSRRFNIDKQIKARKRIAAALLARCKSASRQKAEQLDEQGMMDKWQKKWNDLRMIARAGGDLSHLVKKGSGPDTWAGMTMEEMLPVAELGFKKYLKKLRGTEFEVATAPIGQEKLDALFKMELQAKADAKARKEEAARLAAAEDDSDSDEGF